MIRSVLRALVCLGGIGNAIAAVVYYNSHVIWLAVAFGIVTLFLLWVAAWVLREQKS